MKTRDEILKDELSDNLWTFISTYPVAYKSDKMLKDWIIEAMEEYASQKSESEIGDYKCHVETNVKDSKGNPVFVDKCLKEAVELLNEHGIETIASCCGHCKVSPTILIEQPQPEQTQKGISRDELHNVFENIHKKSGGINELSIDQLTDFMVNEYDNIKIKHLSTPIEQLQPEQDEDNALDEWWRELTRRQIDFILLKIG